MQEITLEGHSCSDLAVILQQISDYLLPIWIFSVTEKIVSNSVTRLMSIGHLKVLGSTNTLSFDFCILPVEK